MGLMMNKKEANKITGGLSAPGKMPEGSYNLPASCMPLQAQNCARSRAHRAGAAMPSRVDTIFQMLKTR